MTVRQPTRTKTLLECFKDSKPGAFKDAVRSHLAKSDNQNMSPPVSEDMAVLLSDVISSSTDFEAMKELTDTYPPFANVSEMVVPRLECALFNRLEPFRKAMDDQLQKVQAAVHAAIVALTPVSQLITDRGGDDKDLNDAGRPLFDAIKLNTFVINAIMKKMKGAFKAKTEKGAGIAND